MLVVVLLLLCYSLLYLLVTYMSSPTYLNNEQLIKGCYYLVATSCYLVVVCVCVWHSLVLSVSNYHTVLSQTYENIPFLTFITTPKISHVSLSHSLSLPYQQPPSL